MRNMPQQTADVEPQIGATTASRQMAKAGHAGGFFSLEMPADQISARFLADDAGIQIKNTLDTVSEVKGAAEGAGVVRSSAP